ncbi:acyl carrier protein [Lachnospiraceae bacterium]|nr:acyl carrier protein [Lachnospiraceae bacterium]
MDFEQVKQIIVDTLGCDEDKVTPEASVMEDLEADSLDLVELHMAFEEAANIKIPDEQLAKLATVGDIVEYLKGATA